MEPSKPTTDPSYFWQSAANITTIVLVAVLGGVSLIGACLTWPEWNARVIEPLANIVTAGATCCGVAVAWRGVTTWRQQIKGSAHFEICRELLRATAKAASRFRSARQVRSNDVEKVDRDRKTFLNEASEAMMEAESLMHQAEDLVDEAIGDAMRDFAHLILEFAACLQKAAPRDEHANQVLDSSLGGSSNPFTQKVEAAFEKIKTLCRPHVYGGVAR